MPYVMGLTAFEVFRRRRPNLRNQLCFFSMQAIASLLRKLGRCYGDKLIRIQYGRIAPKELVLHNQAPPIFGRVRPAPEHT
jgi:hypothetical protein